EERDVDLDPFAGTLALEQRRRDAARDRHAADEVAERGPLLERWLSGRGEPIGDAPAGPERDAVVSATTRIGTTPALAVAARVDDPRVHAPHVVVGETEALARVVEEARDEHVGPFEQAIEQRAPVGRGEIDADAALVPTQVLDQEVAARRAWHQPRGDQAADGIAGARVLDLDDLGPPIA